MNTHNRVFPARSRPIAQPTVDAGRSVIVDCRLVEPEASHHHVIYITEEDESFDKMTVFCFGFAASAMVVVAMLLIALVLQW
jgi:hypothetical protein